MTNEQRDNLITELCTYDPSQVRKIVAEYQLLLKRIGCKFSFYEFLKERFENKDYWHNLMSTQQ